LRYLKFSGLRNFLSSSLLPSSCYLVFFLLGFLLFSSCTKNHLYVQMENVDAGDLASSHVQTPDYRQEDPPIGQKIIVSWSFPYGLYSKKLSLLLTVRYWNNTQDVKIVPLQRSWGTQTFFFANPKRDKDHKILTYRFQVISQKGELIEEWKQQLWTRLIDIDNEEEESDFSASKINP